MLTGVIAEQQRFAFTAWSMFQVVSGGEPDATPDATAASLAKRWNALDDTTREHWRAAADGVFLELVAAMRQGDGTLTLNNTYEGEVVLVLADEVHRVCVTPEGAGRVH